MQYLGRYSWVSSKPRVQEIKSAGGDAEEALQATLLKLARKKTYRQKIKRIIKESGSRILTVCVTDPLLRCSRICRIPQLYTFVLEYKPKSDVRVPDLSPLITAALDEDWPAVQSLRKAHVDEICAQLRRGHPKIRGSRRISMIKFVEENWSESVIAPCLASKMLDRGLAIEQVARTLHELDCDLKVIVGIANVQLTAAFLAYSPLRVDDDNTALRMIVRNVDVAQLEVFLDLYKASHENPWIVAGQLFHLMMDDMSRLNESAAGRSFARRLLRRRDLFTDKYLSYFERVLMRARPENLEGFLEFRPLWPCDGHDLLASAFGNRDPEVLRLLKRSKVDVEARCSRDRSPLHFAADERVVESVRFLLSRGADPNAPDELGRRPLHCVYQLGGIDAARTEECVRLLLIGGADPLLDYQDRRCEGYPKFFGIFAPRLRPEYRRIIEYLLAELAVREALGRSVEQPIEDCQRVMGQQFTDDFYEGCRRQIDQLKSQRIRDNLTMFSLLAGRENRFVRWIDEEDRDSIAAFMRSYKVDKKMMQFYYDVLKERIDMIDRMKIYIKSRQCDKN